MTPNGSQVGEMTVEINHCVRQEGWMWLTDCFFVHWTPGLWTDIDQDSFATWRWHNPGWQRWKVSLGLLQLLLGNHSPGLTLLASYRGCNFSSLLQNSHQLQQACRGHSLGQGHRNPHEGVKYCFLGHLQKQVGQRKEIRITCCHVGWIFAVILGFCSWYLSILSFNSIYWAPAVWPLLFCAGRMWC